MPRLYDEIQQLNEIQYQLQKYFSGSLTETEKMEKLKLQLEVDRINRLIDASAKEIDTIIRDVEDKLSKSILFKKCPVMDKLHTDLRELSLLLCQDLRTAKNYHQLCMIKLNEEVDPLATVHQLSKAVDKLLNPTIEYDKQITAIKKFRNTARNSPYSTAAQVVINTITGALFGMGIFIAGAGIAVAMIASCGGVSLALPAFSLAAGLATIANGGSFGLIFAAHDETPNGHGKAVSQDLRNLIKYRKDLAREKTIIDDTNDKPAFDLLNGSSGIMGLGM